MSEVAVQIKDLTLAYDGEVAVDDVTLTIDSASITGVLGPNGAGKSTLIKAIVGTKEPDRGQVQIFGAPARRGRQGVTYVPQRGTVDWDFPITAAGVVRQGRFRSMGLLGRFRGAERDAVKEAMESVDILDLADRQIGALSGGQQQRVFLARALAQGGDLFVLDEPFAGVDAATESAIIEVLRGLRDAGKTVVVVHHDLTTVADYFDHLVLLNRRLVASGPTDEVHTEDNLRETYGGRVAIVHRDQGQAA